MLYVYMRAARYMQAVRVARLVQGASEEMLTSEEQIHRLLRDGTRCELTRRAPVTCNVQHTQSRAVCCALHLACVVRCIVCIAVEARKLYAATAMNHRSSRAHTAICITVSQARTPGPMHTPDPMSAHARRLAVSQLDSATQRIAHSHLTLVDLAGAPLPNKNARTHTHAHIRTHAQTHTHTHLSPHAHRTLTFPRWRRELAGVRGAGVRLGSGLV